MDPMREGLDNGHTHNSSLIQLHNDMSTYISDEDLLKYVNEYYESESISHEPGPSNSKILTLWRDGDGSPLYATTDPGSGWEEGGQSTPTTNIIPRSLFFEIVWNNELVFVIIWIRYVMFHFYPNRIRAICILYGEVHIDNSLGSIIQNHASSQDHFIQKIEESWIQYYEGINHS